MGRGTTSAVRSVFQKQATRAEGTDRDRFAPPILRQFLTVTLELALHHGIILPVRQGVLHVLRQGLPLLLFLRLSLDVLLRDGASSSDWRAWPRRRGRLPDHGEGPSSNIATRSTHAIAAVVRIVPSFNLSVARTALGALDRKVQKKDRQQARTGPACFYQTYVARNTGTSPRAWLRSWRRRPSAPRRSGRDVSRCVARPTLARASRAAETPARDEDPRVLPITTLVVIAPPRSALRRGRRGVDRGSEPDSPALDRAKRALAWRASSRAAAADAAATRCPDLDVYTEALLATLGEDWRARAPDQEVAAAEGSPARGYPPRWTTSRSSVCRR